MLKPKTVVNCIPVRAIKLSGPPPVEIFIQVGPRPLISSICSFVGFIAALFAAALIYGAAHFKVNTQELFAVSGMASVLFGIIITFAGEATIKKMEL